MSQLVSKSYKVQNSFYRIDNAKGYVNPGVIENSPNICIVDRNDVVDNTPFRRCPRVNNTTD